MSRAEASELVHGLFGCWYPTLVRYALRATGSLEAAEDIVQETFMLLYKALREGQSIDNPKGWTLCVARRQIGKQRRSTARDIACRDSLEVLDHMPQGRLDWEPPAPGLDEASGMLSRLSPREGEVLLLRMQAMKYREIATHLGISPNSVNTLLSRALQKLQKAVRRESVGETVGHALEKTRAETL
jgi:RNA polymerase sigma-70 factor, ECF subfamily